jgi:hypothetical protein
MREVDEISQNPTLNVGFPRGRWLDAAVAAALIAPAAPHGDDRPGQPACRPGREQALVWAPRVVNR